ncbi:MAG: bifunctional diaminohydroxyphosphoribosylaminopyrimidine deaminase/5-amino-6-(5-phosphoribosylamino)uracil reductase RibD [Moraxellaceae bacterium]|nr:bifunctional diaminohydroxyphosphoribosylaminopyrimidine deaminase/5-amino-6-(5-phosphoribosylamino)uracil reductase RibD [Moraxellaceae bacterium]
MSDDIDDLQYMQRALALAGRALYTTTPNPRVGCVIVKDDIVVGEGWHERAGEPHAEVHALRDAGDKARGATAYVTLEPCSHFGRTPPCCDALVRAGVARVVAAMEDPNPRVAGQGFARLRDAGIEVEVGVMSDEARALNEGFLSRVERNRPFVRLKVAASLDGKTALANGESKWITGDAARVDTHHWRARSCAVLTGVGTVLADDPQLNVRAVTTSRQPLRIVLDSALRTSHTARILQDHPTLIVTLHADSAHHEPLLATGAEVLLAQESHGRIDIPQLLTTLAERGINELLVEAGATLNAAFIQSGLVDEYLIYLAPALLGDPARGLAMLPALTSMQQVPRLRFTEVTQVGADLRILARPAESL